MKYNKIEKILQNNNCSLFTLNSTSSTMDEAKKNINNLNSNSNFIIIANEQTHGKGRRGNEWISPPGNIYLSIVLKNDFPIKQHYIFSILTLLSIKKTISEFGSQEIFFKWPNDIFHNNKKFGGLILENVSYNNKNNFIIIGLGINVSSSPQVKGYETTFIKKFIDIDNKIILLECFFLNFFNLFNNIKNLKNRLFLDFKNSLMYLNKKINIQIDNDKKITGIFKDINDEGALVLHTEDNIINIYSGNILI